MNEPICKHENVCAYQYEYQLDIDDFMIIKKIVDDWFTIIKCLLINFNKHASLCCHFFLRHNEFQLLG